MLTVRKMRLINILYRFDDLVSKITTVELPNHVGSLLSKREYHYVLALNYTPYMEALLSQWLYLTLCHGKANTKSQNLISSNLFIENRIY